MSSIYVTLKKQMFIYVNNVFALITIQLTAFFHSKCDLVVEEQKQNNTELKFFRDIFYLFYARDG